MRDNVRIMSLDKANNKLLVDIKKLHCPDNGISPDPANGMPATAAELDLVNGGDDATPVHAADDKEEADAGAGYDLC